MSDKISIEAAVRSDLGKGASRRLRHAGKTPAIVYGAGEPASISFQHKDLWKAQEAESFYSSVISLNIEGKQQDVILKDMQRHPAKALIMHVDFQRVDDNTEIIMNVPLHFINAEKCPGVKLEGGIVQYQATVLKIRCAATKLPEYIEVDLSDAKSGDIVHISDLKLPEGVESVELSYGADHDTSIVQINTPKAKDLAEPTEEEAEDSGDEADSESEEGDTEE